MIVRLSERKIKGLLRVKGNRTSVTATSVRDIKELIIFRNNKPVRRLEPGKKETELDEQLWPL